MILRREVAGDPGEGEGRDGERQGAMSQRMRVLRPPDPRAAVRDPWRRIPVAFELCSVTPAA